MVMVIPLAKEGVLHDSFLFESSPSPSWLFCIILLLLSRVTFQKELNGDVYFGCLWELNTCRFGGPEQEHRTAQPSSIQSFPSRASDRQRSWLGAWLLFIGNDSKLLCKEMLTWVVSFGGILEPLHSFLHFQRGAFSSSHPQSLTLHPPFSLSGTNFLS